MSNNGKEVLSMSFDINRFTQKSQEAIIEAQNLAQDNGHSQVEPEHLFKALLTQQGGIVPQIMEKLNIPPANLINQVSKELDRLPRMSGGNVQIGISPRLRAVLVSSHDEMSQFGDQYVSAEHLLLALLNKGGGASEQIMKQAGLPRDRLLKVLKEIRGNQKVTSQTPEGTYAA